MSQFDEILNTLKNLGRITTMKDFSEQMGIGYTYISDMRHGRRVLSRSLVEKINTMFGTTFEFKEQKGTMIPYFDVVATGSSQGVEVLNDPAMTYQSQFIDVGGLMPRAEFVIRVSGNSMMPNYPSGCVIGIRQILDGYFDYGSVYVIETEDNRFVKRVFKGKADDHVQLYSDNIQIFTEGPRKGQEHYEPFQMPLKKIQRIFKVVGVAKTNDHSFIPKL